MADINIVLVEPEIPQNTGNIARTCAATGAALHLVRPLGFEIDDRKLRRAGLDYWNKLDITYYDSLSDFLEQHGGDPLYLFSTKAPRAYTRAGYFLYSAGRRADCLRILSSTGSIPPSACRCARRSAA